jgi:hypothetical protein
MAVAMLILRDPRQPLVDHLLVLGTDFFGSTFALYGEAPDCNAKWKQPSHRHRPPVELGSDKRAFPHEKTTRPGNSIGNRKGRYPASGLSADK